MYCLLLCTVESLVQQLLMSSEIKTSAYGKGNEKPVSVAEMILF